jgi:hypothetical protein
VRHRAASHSSCRYRCSTHYDRDFTTQTVGHFTRLLALFAGAMKGKLKCYQTSAEMVVKQREGVRSCNATAHAVLWVAVMRLFRMTAPRGAGRWAWDTGSKSGAAD